MSNVSFLDESSPPPAPLRRRYSKFGVAGLVFSVLLLLGSGVFTLLIFFGYVALRDNGRIAPGYILGGVALALLASIIAGCLWLLAATLSLIGLYRTRWHCWWSRIAVTILTIIPLGFGGWWLIEALK